jgi:transposase-like protein
MANADVRGRPIAPLVLSAQERAYLERQVRRQRVARSLSERCRVILRCADGLPSKDVAAELGLHEHTVGKWRRRFLKDRCDGLLDEARPGRPRTIDDDQVAAVIERGARHRSTRRTGRSARWRRKLAFPTPRSAGCGWRSACSHTVARHSSCRTIRCRRQGTRYRRALPFPAQPSPRPQHVSKAGNPRLRTTMIQLAWLWVRHQPRSILTLWFRQRVQLNGGRIRKVMIVALARKLLIAFWKYVTAGVVLEGAETTAG